MPAALKLGNKFIAYRRRVFTKAVEIQEGDFQVSELIPDSGQAGGTRDGLRLVDVSNTSPRYSAVAVSGARNQFSGVDYPAILEKAPRIAPKNVKVIRFMLGDGQWRSIGPEGIDNRWFQWWSDYWASGVWRDSLELAQRDTVYR